MSIIARILVLLVGALFLFLGVGVWFNFDQGLAGFALTATEPLGRAAMRADFGGFFFSIATFSFLAAWHKSRWWAAAAAILLGFALSGRALSILLEGPATGGTMPMLVEAGCVAVLLGARALWSRG
jgi:hypothetical protein